MLNQQALQQAQLTGEQQQQSQRAQLFPGQLAEQNVSTQLAQNKLASQQAMTKAWSDPSFAKEVTAAPSSSGGTEGNATPSTGSAGFDPDAMTQGLIKRGVQPQDALALTNQFVDRSAKTSEMIKNNAAAASDQIGNYQKSVKDITDRLSSIMDMPVSKAGPAFDVFKQDVASNKVTGLNPQQVQALQNSTLDKLPAFVNMAQIESNIADYHKKEADDQLAQTNAQKSKMELPGGPMNQVTQHIQEETDPRVLAARAQQAALSQQQIQKSLYGGSPLEKVPPALAGPAAAAATKIYQNYTQAQQAGNELQSMVDLAKGGNKVAYAYSPVTGVLQINVAGQIKRVNMPEIESYGGAGSALDNIKGWIGKRATGASIPDDVLNDMSSVSKMVTQGAETRHESDISNLNKTYGSSFQPMANTAPSKAVPTARSIGDSITIKGKPLKITKVYPDGSFDAQ